jgi:hypothetical protein
VFLSRSASVKTALLDCNVTMCSFNCPVIFSGTVLARAGRDDYSEACCQANFTWNRGSACSRLILY